MSLRFPAMVLLLGLLASCAGQEVLVAKSAAVPAGVDLSGQWQLRRESSDTLDKLALPRGGERFELPPRKANSKKRDKGSSLVRVFLETGASLKVTQTDFALFVSFDRSIVEEYRFGENRNVNVGPVVAQRVSGWDGSSYVVETLTDDGHKLIDRYLLESDSTVLLRQVSFYEKGELTQSIVQKFDRAQ